MVIGDFNAHTGRAADFIISDSDADYATYDTQYSPDLKCDIRNSEDEIICSRGRDLLDLCIQSKMRILNGRLLGDLSGKYTSHRSLGSSVIDYCICSDKLLSKILSMKVHDFDRSLSNHCMLSCILSVNFEEHRPELDNLYPLPIKYAWNSSSIEKFQNALQSAPVTAKVSHFLSENSPSFCNLKCAVHDLNNLIHDAASISLKLKARNTSKKRTFKHKKMV